MEKLPEQIRAFIAFRLPDHVKNQISDVQQAFKKRNISARYIPPENMHLTLKFIGDMPNHFIAPIRKIMTDSMSTCHSITLKADGIGAFPNKHLPRVIWAGLHSEESVLSDLHKTIDKKLESLGIQVDNRVYTGHLTLARLKKKPEINTIVKMIDHFRNFKTETFKAGSLVLFRSELTPEGPIYTELCSV